MASSSHFISLCLLKTHRVWFSDGQLPWALLYYNTAYYKNIGTQQWHGRCSSNICYRDRAAAWLFWESTMLPASPCNLLCCLPLLGIYYNTWLFLETTMLPGSWNLLGCLPLFCNLLHCLPLFFWNILLCLPLLGICDTACIFSGIYYAVCSFFGICYATCIFFGIY